MILLAIDPGRDTGFAFFYGDRLWVCGLVKPRHLFAIRPDVVMIEKPRSYPDAPVDPNNLLKLQERASEMAGMLLATGAEIRYCYPRDWKGTMSKAVCHSRIMKRLGPGDNPVGTSNHNVWDAVGIGLWAVGRFRNV